MPKTVTRPPFPLDVRAFAVRGARLQLQALHDERARIAAMFPELRRQLAATKTQRLQPPTPRELRTRLRRLIVPIVIGERTCPFCARTFTPTPQQIAVLARHPDATLVCVRPRCKQKKQRAYMRAYFEKRAAAARGES
jgi:hypothetical protein